MNPSGFKRKAIIFSGLYMAGLSCAPRYAGQPPGRIVDLSPASELISPEQGRDRSAAGKIRQTGKGRWLLPVSHKDAWEGVLEVLVSAYNIEVINEGSRVITTGWDRYYRDHKVYRNKVTVRLTPLDYKVTALQLQNTVEVLEDGSASGHFSQIWLPARIQEHESSRLMAGLSSWLGLSGDRESGAAYSGRSGSGG